MQTAVTIVAEWREGHSGRCMCMVGVSLSCVIEKFLSLELAKVFP